MNRLCRQPFNHSEKGVQSGQEEAFLVCGYLMVGVFFFSGLALAQERRRKTLWQDGNLHLIPPAQIQNHCLKRFHLFKRHLAGFALRDELGREPTARFSLTINRCLSWEARWRCSTSCRWRYPGHARQFRGLDNLGPRFGLVNLPFLIDSFDKLDKFVASGNCWITS